MKSVVLALDAFEPATWTEHECESVCEFLLTQFERFPAHARIYHKEVAQVCDVTPGSEADIEALEQMEGPFIVVIYPALPLWAIIAIIAVVAIAASLLLMPTVTIPNQTQPSPTNQLSDRSNSARPRARIPDVYGEVDMTPDLIQVPYRIFDVNSQEFELAFMCATRGQVDVVADDVKESDTKISAITGASAEVYAPFTSPNSGSPQLTVGSSIGTGVITVVKSNSVNGQDLFAPNYKSLAPSVACYFKYPNIIHTTSTAIEELTHYFEPGDSLVITDAIYTAGATTANLNGNYPNAVINIVGNDMSLTLTAPQTTEWNKLAVFSSNHTATGGATITAFSAPLTIGGFIVDDPTLTGVMLNFVASGGLYKQNGNISLPFPVSIDVGTTPVNSAGVAIGGETVTSFTLPASGTNRTQKALTAIVAVTGRTSVRVTRTTPTDYNYAGSVVDGVKWRDLYGVSPVSQSDFGNVTTIQTKTQATTSATGVSSRKFHLKGTRMVPVRIGSTSTFGALTATRQADAIICAIALDPYIGNRPIGELDVSNIYATVAAVVAYFGTTDAAEFCYTFDDGKISYQETLALIADAIFCVSYRSGSLIQLALEKLTADSKLIFNHRNMVPKSEQRSDRFGNQDDVDGVLFNYVNPDDETPAQISLPVGVTCFGPKVVDSVGVRNVAQATLKANRIWNKARFQNRATSFTGTQETKIVKRTDRILIADTTRPDTQAGEVLSQTVLQLTLSQPFIYTSLSHTIFLQLYDGTVQAIGIASATSGTPIIVLAAPPTLALALTDDLYARTTYTITPNSGSVRSSAFLIDTKVSNDNSTGDITAINYDDRYYANDQDFA